MKRYIKLKILNKINFRKILEKGFKIQNATACRLNPFFSKIKSSAELS